MNDICNKARALATQAAQDHANKDAATEQAFMDSLFPDRSQYTNHGDHTYTICGLRWRYREVLYRWGEDIAKLNLGVIWDHPDNQYRGIKIGSHITPTIATTLIEFGDILLRRDELVGFIDKTYPNTLWGNFRLWFNYRIL